MNANILEQSSVQSNCQLCGIDEPFFMPLDRYDPIFMRVQIPYYEYILNSNDFPVIKKIEIVDDTGTYMYGTVPTLGYKSGVAVDFDKKLIEYQFLFPTPFRHEPTFGQGHTVLYTFSAGNGDVIEYERYLTGETQVFIVGIDEIPSFFLQISSNVYMVADVNVSTLSLLKLKINGVNVTPTLLLGYGAPLTQYKGQCFRYKITFGYDNSGKVIEIFTKPYKIVKCEETTLIESYNPNVTTDCVEHLHFSSWDYLGNYLRYRVYGDLQTANNIVKKTYNNKYFSVKSEYQKKYNLVAELMPEWYANEIEGCLLSQHLYINRNKLYNDESENTLLIEDLATNYKKIDLTLSASKCEFVFSC